MQKKTAFLFYLVIMLLVPTSTKAANSTGNNDVQARMQLYKEMEASTQFPWYYLAAIDQYERSLRFARQDLQDPKGNISIYIPDEKWAGLTNPDPKDTNLYSIQIFGGIGLDGNGDKKADKNNDKDVLYTITQYYLGYGRDKDHFKIGVWDYYKRDRAVSIILGDARLFQKYGTIDLQKKVFPVPLNSDYTYRSTWGVARGWGGRRSHEGTDIFSSYGVPVRSTCYGIIELKGWNRYGGWRIGIRDINNTYHYYAHLSGFANGIHIGQLVQPGMIIGSVGSSGYGPPGTSGKFPPHLHYGLYKENGKTEWSFDPYPYLRIWERNERRK